MSVLLLGVINSVLPLHLRCYQFLCWPSLVLADISYVASFHYNCVGDGQ